MVLSSRFVWDQFQKSFRYTLDISLFVLQAADSEPPAPRDTAVLPPVSKKQTVLINAHICEHCHEVLQFQ